MEKEWRLNKIMKGLETLNPDFYPCPSRQIRRADGRIDITDDTEVDALTKEDLLKLYVRCGDLLHCGAIKKKFKSSKQKDINFSKIAEYAQRIFNLLGCHSILLHDQKSVIHCTVPADPRQRVRTHRIVT
jgi:hypothetical protein